MAPADKGKKSRLWYYDLGNGVVRFSRSRVHHKKALYKFVGKKVAPTKKTSKPKVVVKPIGGEKNGGTRVVLVQKRREVYPTQEKNEEARKAAIQKPRENSSSQHHPRNCPHLAGWRSQGQKGRFPEAASVRPSLSHWAFPDQRLPFETH